MHGISISVSLRSTPCVRLRAAMSCTGFGPGGRGAVLHQNGPCSGYQLHAVGGMPLQRREQSQGLVQIGQLLPAARCGSRARSAKQCLQNSEGRWAVNGGAYTW